MARATRAICRFMRLVLYQPDIPQNAGAAIRLGACLGVGVDVIEPCGFVLDERRVRRAGMDYTAMADVSRHGSWEAFVGHRGHGRLVLLSTKGEDDHLSFRFRPDDRLILGRESSGVPSAVAERADAVLRIPMMPGARSLNVVTAAALALAEALRQTTGWPDRTAEHRAPAHAD